MGVGYFLRRFLCLRPRSVMLGGVREDEMGRFDEEAEEKNWVMTYCF